jgi:hypothetical protein
VPKMCHVLNLALIVRYIVWSEAFLFNILLKLPLEHIIKVNMQVIGIALGVFLEILLNL